MKKAIVALFIVVILAFGLSFYEYGQYKQTAKNLEQTMKTFQKQKAEMKKELDISKTENATLEKKISELTNENKSLRDQVQRKK